MKRFTYAMVMAVALVVLVSSFAVAGDGCKSKASAEKVSMSDCCIKAAKANEGCCGKDADTVKASLAAYSAGGLAAEQAACSASATAKTASWRPPPPRLPAPPRRRPPVPLPLPTRLLAPPRRRPLVRLTRLPTRPPAPTCTSAVRPPSPRARAAAARTPTSFRPATKRRLPIKAAASVTADMHECCATALSEGKGCCGQSADQMKADFDKKVSEESKKVASS